MEVFFDSSAIIALAYAPDRHHHAARTQEDQLPTGVARVASDYVFGETLTVLQRLGGHRAAVRAGQALRASSRWRWEKVTEADFEDAWAIFQRNKQALSFNDCTVLAQMKRLGIDSIFTFDKAFRKAGVKVVP